MTDDVPILDAPGGKPFGFVPKGVMSRKPAYGKPCTGCGACCMVTLCDLGQHVFGLPEIGRCPALTQTSETTYGCGLAIDPARFVPKARVLAKGAGRLKAAAFLLIGGGEGCDARFNGEPRDEEHAARIDRQRMTAGSIRAAIRAKQTWGAKP
jgi:hypothetical protein